jgi:hypothetical protein
MKSLFAEKERCGVIVTSGGGSRLYVTLSPPSRNAGSPTCGPNKLAFAKVSEVSHTHW